MYTRILAAAVAAGLLGACGAEDDTQGGVEIGAATMQLDPELAEAAEEAWLLYDELAARLEERGVTLEELQAAADANDEEAIRELFGYSPEEYAAANARVLDLAERAQAVGAGDYLPPEPPVDLEGWDCDFVGASAGIGDCLLHAAWLTAQVKPPHPVLVLALYAGDAALCAAAVSCRWDSTDPRPRTKPK